MIDFTRLVKMISPKDKSVTQNRLNGICCSLGSPGGGLRWSLVCHCLSGSALSISVEARRE